MGEDTARLRQEIEQTREDLSRDVDAVAFKASPQRMVNDRVEGARSKVMGIKDKVMGGGSDGPSMGERASGMTDVAGERVHGAQEHLSGAAHGVADAAGQAPQQVRQKAQGNPLAAGLIAFGVGWLVSSLMPATEAETRVARQGTELAKDKGAPLLDQVKHEAKQVGQEAAEHLRPAAQDAVRSVKDTATEGVQEVKEHGTQAAQNVKGEAASGAQDVKESATSGAGGSGSATGTIGTDPSTPVYSETVDVTGTEVVSPQTGRSTGTT